MRPPEHITASTTVRHRGGADDTDRGRRHDLGWTIAELALIVMIIVLLAGATTWAVLTLRDDSAGFGSVEPEGAARVVGGEGATPW